MKSRPFLLRISGRAVRRILRGAAVAALLLAGVAALAPAAPPPAGGPYEVRHGLAGFGGARSSAEATVVVAYVGLPGAGRAADGVGRTLVGGVTGLSPLAAAPSAGLMLR